MEPRRLLQSLFLRTFASRTLRDAVHLLADCRRWLSGGGHVVEYFHQVDDPYSHLTVQALGALCDLYDVRLQPHLAGPADADNAPERDLLEAWSRRDAADVAPHYGLEFEDPGAGPDPELTGLARRVIATAVTGDRFVELTTAAGRALWRGDRAALEELVTLSSAVDGEAAQAIEDAGSALRARFGHYAGAMLRYGGEWYWGVDRLVHLETRLSAQGLQRSPAAFIAPRPVLQYPVDARRASGLTLECFPSLRSPYSAIVLRRVVDYARTAGIGLRMRPVLPMVMRGVSLTPAKGRYIAMDTAREADLAGAAFGWVCDPIGYPVERGFAVWKYAREEGRETDFLLSFIEGVWAHGIDAGSDDGLQRIVERCGLSWFRARQRLLDDSWREELEENRQLLYELGLWGVPSFRLLGPGGETLWSGWGQDRLWRVTQEVARHAGG